MGIEGLAPVGAIFAAAVAATWLLRKRRIVLEGRGSSGKFEHALVQNAFDVCLPFAVVAGAYTWLGTIVQRADRDAETIERIATLERALRNLKEFAGALGPGKWTSLALLVALFCLSLYLRRRVWSDAERGRQTALRILFHYQKALGSVSLITAALCSFTFFNDVAGSHHADRLRLRLKAADAEYQKLVESTGAALENAVATDLVERAVRGSHSSYQSLLKSWQRNVAKRSELGQRYASSSKRYRFNWTPGEQLQAEARTNKSMLAQALQTAEHEVPPLWEATSTPPEPPGSTSQTRIRASQRKLDGISKHGAEATKAMFGDAAGEKIVPKLVGMAIDPKLTPLQPLLAEVPLLAPFMDVLSDSVSSTVATTIRERTQVLVDQILARPTTDARAAIQEQVARIGDERPVRWSPTRVSQLLPLEQRLASQEASTLELERALAAEEKRAKPLAEALLRGENERLATQFRSKMMAIPRSTSVGGLDLRRWLDDLAKGSRVGAAQPRDATQRMADDFLDRIKAADPWKANEVLVMGIQSLNSASNSRSHQLAALAKVTERHFPETPLHASIASEVNQSRPSLPEAHFGVPHLLLPGMMPRGPIHVRPPTPRPIRPRVRP
jgi:hypothetical protein